METSIISYLEKQSKVLAIKNAFKVVTYLITTSRNAAANTYCLLLIDPCLKVTERLASCSEVKGFRFRFLFLFLFFYAVC